jgi:hypothetical protein
VPPRVGVFHAPHAAVGLRHVLRAARGLCTVVIVLRESVARANPGLVDVARALFEVAVHPDGRTSDAVPERGLAGVTTFHDDELAFADAAARRWGLPGAPATADPWDKLHQRQAFAACDLSQRRAVAVDSPADLAAAVAGLGLPGALKPRRSTASVGVALLSTPDEVRAQVTGRAEWRSLLYEELIPFAAHPSGVAWLAGYVSVETASGAAGHRHVAVFDKVPVAVAASPGSLLSHAVRETGDVLPTRLPGPVLAGALATTSRALDALGVRRRVTHTELALTPAGLDVIEVNGRLGGEVARMVGMLDGPDVARAALTLALGGEPALDAAWSKGAVACLYVPFPRRGGLVRAGVTRADLRDLPGVVAVDEVAARGARRGDTAFRAAKLTVAGPGPGELDEAVAGVLDRIAALFAADGLDRDAWLSGLRERIRRPAPAAAAAVRLAGEGGP